MLENKGIKMIDLNNRHKNVYKVIKNKKYL